MPRRRQTRRKRNRKPQRPRSQKGGAAAPIKVVTYADKRKPTLDALEASCKGHGYEFEIVAFGQPWEGFIKRVEHYRTAAAAQQAAAGPDALMVFTDAFDTVCIQDAATLAAKYKAKPRKPPVVLGVENCCFENCDRGTLEWYTTHQIPGGRAAKEATVEPYEPNPGRHSLFISKESIFPNFGVVLGPAAALERMFSWIVSSGLPDDQFAAGKYLLGHPDQVDLDIEQTMIRNKVLERDQKQNEGSTAGPAFLHFPGMRDGDAQQKLLEYFTAYDTPVEN